VAVSDTKSQSVLRDEILADAQRSATRLIRKAERDAGALVDKATADSQQERSAKLEAARTSAEHGRTLMLATVPVEVGRMRAVRVEQELQQLREQVRQALQQLSDADYEQTLASLAARALAQMEGEAFVLELSAHDLQTCGQKLPAAVLQRVTAPGIAVTVSTQPAEIGGGVIVRDPEGRQVWDNSLEARLDRMWPLLRNEIADNLGLEHDAADSGEQP
jgi:V/A-type H+-transporting ATPase subunit E